MNDATTVVFSVKC